MVQICGGQRSQELVRGVNAGIAVRSRLSSTMARSGLIAALNAATQPGREGLPLCMSR